MSRAAGFLGSLPSLGLEPAAHRHQAVGRRQGLSCRAATYGQPGAPASNLGVLQSLAQADAAAPGSGSGGATSASSGMELRAQQAPHFSGGVVIDGTAITTSLVVLVLLLALSTNRIFGLERFLGKQLLVWKEEREAERAQEAAIARQALEQQFAADEGRGEDDGMAGKPGKPGSGSQ